MAKDAPEIGRPALDIRQIKKQGAINELKREIDLRQHRITNKGFNSTLSGNHYCRLGEALSEVKVNAEEMETLLVELRKLEPENK